MQRRRFNAAGSALILAACGSGRAQAGGAVRQGRFEAEVRRIEAAVAGRLGVCIRDTASGAEYAHRPDERFPMTSTFKMLAAAVVLSRVDSGAERLARRVRVQAADIVPYSPVTQPRVNGEPMTVAELCHASVAISDNAAANILLRSFGGPPALTAYARSLGDEVTRLDRFEPELNEATPGDPRDTSSPRAMLRTMDQLVLGNALAPASREQLTAWLLGNQVGATRLRAGLPTAWRIADKTGAGSRGTNNDVGVCWPPGGSPVLVTAFLTGAGGDGSRRDRALAEVGRLAAELAT